MTYFDDRAQARAAATRLHSLLTDVRAAPKDARSYMLFDRRDELKGLGIDDNQVASFDPSADALDTHIANLGEVAGHRRKPADEDAGFIRRPSLETGTRLALTGTLAGGRSNGVQTDCTYNTPVGQFTIPVHKPYAACAPVAVAPDWLGRKR